MTDPRERKPPTPADVGGLLTEIRTAYEELVAEAVYAAEARDYPGGDAMHLLGPAADMESWEHKYETAERRAETEREKGHLRRAEEITAYVGDQFDTESHPELVLTDWETRIREQRDETVDLKSDVTHAVTYLRDAIDWMFSINPEGQPAFAGTTALVRDLRKVRRNLQTVTKSGKRAEFTRVTCIAVDCPTHPRLMKLWAAKVKWDRYRCPACRTEYTQAQYSQAEAENLRSVGTRRYVTIADAMKAARVNKRTMYSWVQRKRVGLAWRRGLTGFERVVWWPDVQERASELRTKQKAS